MTHTNELATALSIGSSTVVVALYALIYLGSAVGF
jgi:hypothetical protein